jgi:hypothetical protein
MEAVVDAAALGPDVTRVALRRETEPVRLEDAVRPAAVVGRSTDDYGHEGARHIDSDELAPVVHVSIGRIEVRAPQPPPARSAPAPIAPSLTLDAYLRRRDKDVRR